jgi:hypothetical protein
MIRVGVRRPQLAGRLRCGAGRCDGLFGERGGAGGFFGNTGRGCDFLPWYEMRFRLGHDAQVSYRFLASKQTSVWIQTGYGCCSTVFDPAW